jgi:hypothetical protein
VTEPRTRLQFQCFPSWMLQQGSFLAQQRFHFAPQIPIATAGLFQVCSALFGSLFESEW